MKKYLTAMIAGQLFAIPVTAVEDVMALPHVTPVQRMPSYIRGVVHVRGRIFPVMDMLVFLEAGRLSSPLAAVIAADGAVVAITADRILDVKELPEEEKLVPTLDNRVKSVASAAIFDGTDFYLVLDPSKIVALVKKKEAAA